MSTRESATSSAVAAALETVEIPSGPDPDAAVIWLHGLGADGHDFEPIVPHLQWPGAPAIRYVFPHAPVRPVTLNGGVPMRAWYDIISLSSDRNQDEQGIMTSVRQTESLIRAQRERGIASERIVVAGFSQGGAIALLAALRYREPLAGLVALSTYLLLGARLESEVHEANRGLPVFVGHGSQDPMVPIALGEETATRLRELSYPVEWHSYAMPHAVCPEEISDLKAWLRARLG
ncbi:MAG: dienelactone hydrolase family protein [Xanthomonadales bacterium]|nr:dienelactone hydrolase family protein [Xanthomonadales bacterium]